MPDVPTFKEAGVEGVVAVAWNALIAPASVSKPVLDEISKHATAALNDPALKDNFAKQIMEATPMTPEQAKAYVAAELVKWAAIVKAAGIEPQ
jgi:tripartite-type tricarboxylate transporter receptor subunit TctC